MPELVDHLTTFGAWDGKNFNRTTNCPTSGKPCAFGGCQALTNKFPVCSLAGVTEFASTDTPDAFYELADIEYSDLKDSQRSCYIGFPDTEKLDVAGGVLFDAFHETSYLVGSATYTKRYRDVDIRMIMADDKYDKLFGTTSISPLWSVLCASISSWLRDLTGLPIDFQIQKQSSANNYRGTRHPLGMNHRIRIDNDSLPLWLKRDTNDDDTD